MLSRRKYQRGTIMYVKNSVAIYRRKAGLRQIDLANAVGIKRTHLSFYEQGHCILSFEKLEEIARALNVTIDRLYPPAAINFLLETDKADTAHVK